MTLFFRNRFLSALALTFLAALLLLLLTGELDLTVLFAILLLSATAFSYPSFVERRWQSRMLPPDTLHIPISRIRAGNDTLLLKLFDLPQMYLPLKGRYSLRATDPSAPGLFLYIYLPTTLYEMRNIGPESVYQHLAARLKRDLQDAQDTQWIAQRALPLAFGFRFLPKQGFPYHELSRTIDVAKKEYFRENTSIRGVLQSKRRMFRMHAPEDNEWRTFQPYQEDSVLLYGGSSLSHDFRANPGKRVPLNQIVEIGAERIEYPEAVPFGSLLTYAKKGEIILQGSPDAVDKLYIDRVNVLVHGTEHRGEILETLSKELKRELSEEDFYPLFNYGQKLRGFLPPGKSLSDFVSSHGNFAIYYDSEKGWTILKLEPRLELRLQEAFWSNEPRIIQTPASLTTSRAALMTGAPDSQLQFHISTGTPTRGQVFSADELIEEKMKNFASAREFQIVRSIGSGAEGCLYLAEKKGNRFYIKSPDGQLAGEEIQTIETLKKSNLIPREIQTYAEDRIIVLPEYASLPVDPNGPDPVARALLFQYLKRVWDAGYLCLDLTPDHVKLDAGNRMLFLIDFSGYVQTTHFRKHPVELLADRKKIEYRTPEESVRDFRDVEKFQIYLIGLLFYQMADPDGGLPFASKYLGNGSAEYKNTLSEDLKRLKDASHLDTMLGYDPSERGNFSQLQNHFALVPEEVEIFWKKMQL